MIYSWRVPGRRTQFEDAWERLTLAIRQGVPGAMGSVLTWATQEPDVAVAMARWRSIEDWQNRVNFEPDPDVSLQVESLAVLESVEVLDERFDLTMVNRRNDGAP